MRRRQFLALVSGTAFARPLTAAAQQPAMPVVGYLGSEIEDNASARFRAFHKALGEAGFTEGRNLAIEYRWAQAQVDRYPALAADLVGRGVSVIASMGGVPSARAAKAATTNIPIVAQGGFDPVETGVVASLSRPGGNITGATNFGVSLAPKRLEVMHELIPDAKVFGLLVNPTHPLAAVQTRDVEAAARVLGLQIRVVNAATVKDFDKAFASLAPLGARGLVIVTGQPFTTRPVELAELALRYRMPTVAEAQEFVASGGLMAYSGSREETYSLAGQYVGRILKGAKPAELPILQSTKVELFINVKTAKTMGLTIPLSLLGRADEVIE